MAEGRAGRGKLRPAPRDVAEKIMSAEYEGESSEMQQLRRDLVRLREGPDWTWTILTPRRATCTRAAEAAAGHDSTTRPRPHRRRDNRRRGTVVAQAPLRLSLRASGSWVEAPTR